ncbi:hypothetical protein PCH_Pc17g00210 [Penicillium rubens Wisconsin 54-1255]|uniref:Uncharacterized protein n=1 Tax=Penicillium rubens (strain ATCC 28089 / DSM 1075 / NRRL 1951 / Wisconsin 54-1255) TaxID=500485 RepID=B6HAV3_PENRW|nr:hypothetical protein PCH_Pc17g00210 [Penicillium rubens Wisconsin 54-1255]
MARPRRPSRNQQQSRIHVQVPNLLKGQVLTVKDFPPPGRSRETRSHSIISMQRYRDDTATNEQGQPETSTVFSTTSQNVAGGTSTRSSWRSQPAIKRLVERYRGKIDTIFTTSRIRFQFVHKWLLEESLMVGWTCPEELELHKLSKCLVEHRTRLGVALAAKPLLLYKNGKDWFLASATLLSTVFHRIVNLFSTWPVSPLNSLSASVDFRAYRSFAVY